MGRTVCSAVTQDPDLTLVAAIDRRNAGKPLAELIGQPGANVVVSDEPDTLLQAETEVAVDFTHPDSVMEDVRWAIDHAMHIVVGTTGVTSENLDEIRRLIERHHGDSNVIVAPNFAIGAVLAERFAAQAARVFPAVEVIELHHDGKADAPSGSAAAVAKRIAAARDEDWRGPMGETVEGARGGDVEGIRVHSVRLPGLVAHEEIIFGAPGQTLTIRHDSMDRASFMPGVLLAIKAISTRPGLTVGLEPLLDV
jgi:4-hydroxy-tetrahydrodipicolinate reductase